MVKSFDPLGLLDLYANKLTGTITDKQREPPLLVWHRFPILQSQTKPSLAKGLIIESIRKTSGAMLNANC